MAPAIAFTEEDTKLMVALISQMGVGNIDYIKLREDLGLPPGNAANMRVSRLKSKLAKATEQGIATSPSKDKQASPNKRKAEKHDDNEQGEAKTPRKSGRKPRASYKETDIAGIDLLDLASYDQE